MRPMAAWLGYPGHSQLLRGGVLATVLTMAVASACWAQQADAGFRHDAEQPIEVVSDSLEIAKDQETAIFTGNVNAVQGRMGLRADMIKVKYRAAKGSGASKTSLFSRIDATGNVVLQSPDETATGDWAVYEVDDKTITLGGSVVLTRGNSVIKGQRLVVNLTTGQSKIDGGAEVVGQQRVRAVFTPKRKERSE